LLKQVLRGRYLGMCPAFRRCAGLNLYAVEKPQVVNKNLLGIILLYIAKV